MNCIALKENSLIEFRERKGERERGRGRWKVVELTPWCLNDHFMVSALDGKKKSKIKKKDRVGNQVYFPTQLDSCQSRRLFSKDKHLNIVIVF